MCQNSCGATVAAALQAVPGAVKVTVSFEQAGAVVTGTAEMFDLIEAVEDVGFDAVPRTYLSIQTNLDSNTSTNSRADTIKTKLEEVPGVQYVQVLWGEALVIVDGPVPAAQLRDLIQDSAGVVSVVPITVTGSIADGERLHKRLGSIEPSFSTPTLQMPTAVADLGTTTEKEQTESCNLSAKTAAVSIAEFDVDGMMCQNSCASTVANAIGAIQGVEAVAVSHAKKNALVRGSFHVAEVVEAIEAVGFDARLKENTDANTTEQLEASIAAGGPGTYHAPAPTRLAQFTVDGMMCQNSCASVVAAAISAVDGVTAVAVSHPEKRALVEGTFAPGAVLEAVEEVGFEVTQVDPINRDASSILSKALAAGGPGVHESKVTTLTARPANPRQRRQSKPPPLLAVSVAAELARMWMCDYIVSGIVCAACATRIQNAVRALDGVTVVRVGVITEKLHVCFDADLQSQSVIEAAVESLGYKLTLVRSVAVGNGVRVNGDPESVQESTVKSHAFLVTGMTCANCAAKIERALNAMEGVNHVAVSVTTNRVEVQTGPVTSSSRECGVRTIMEVIQDLGFGVRENSM